MKSWAFLVVDLKLPEPEQSRLVEGIERAGWRPLCGFPGHWYGRCGEFPQGEVIAIVKRMLETAMDNAEIGTAVSFAVHTGRSTPYIGTLRRRDTRLVGHTADATATEPIYRRTRPYRIPHPLHTRRQPKDQADKRKPE